MKFAGKYVGDMSNVYTKFQALIMNGKKSPHIGKSCMNKKCLIQVNF